jgi:CheY-like chemotaxis protein
MRLFTPRLLITDDDRDFRETVAGVFADRGLETLQAADGEEALELVKSHEIHLLLLDMQMPRITGLELIERLRDPHLEVWQLHADLSAEQASRSPLALRTMLPQQNGDEPEGQAPLASAAPDRRRFLPPWILISGALDERLIERARAAEAFSVLPKPVRLPELTGTVASALARAYNWHAS